MSDSDVTVRKHFEEPCVVINGGDVCRVEDTPRFVRKQHTEGFDRPHVRQPRFSATAATYGQADSALRGQVKEYADNWDKVIPEIQRHVKQMRNWLKV